MFDMRLRLREMMDTHPRIRTAYALSKASKGVISPTNAHRLVHSGGNVARIELDTLGALCRVFGVTPNDLIDFEEDAH